MLQTYKRQEGGNLLSGHLALITGASGGVGEAIALAFARQGARVCALGRNPAALETVVEAARAHSEAVGFQVDLTKDEDLQGPAKYLAEAGGVSILVHSAGIHHQDPLEYARISDFDLQYLTNVRAPYRLTQLLLPQLVATRGQIVFINSSSGITAKPMSAQYDATKHALKAIADSLRGEVNQHGVRVLSVYLGRTATDMQAHIHASEGKRYQPELLLQPADVASVIVNSLRLPRTAEVTDVHIRPMIKS